MSECVPVSTIRFVHSARFSESEEVHMSINRLALAAALLFGLSTTAFAVDPPRQVWLKAKCAVCHAVDGSGNTDEGRKLATPDLRTEPVQKKTDQQLATEIKAGHSRMPAFKVQLDDQQVGFLVSYIRFIAVKK